MNALNELFASRKDGVIGRVLERLNGGVTRCRRALERPPQRRKMLFESLEPRLLLSGDLVPGVNAPAGGESAGLVITQDSGGPQLNFSTFASGGGYQESFITSRNSGDFATPLVVVPPRGGLVYAGGVEGYAEVGTTGTHSVDLEAGQYFSLRLRPTSGDLQASVLVTGPDARTWTATAGGAGQGLVLNFSDGLVDGTYNIEVSSLAGAGNYELDLFLNAGLEEPDSSDTLTPDLSLFAIDVTGDGATRSSVVGRIDYTPDGEVPTWLNEYFDDAFLPSWEFSGWGPGYTGWEGDQYGGYLNLEGGEENLDGWMPADSLHEATWQVDLEGVTQATLQFSERGDDRAEDILDAFSGSFEGDGVVFSVDGDTWYPLVSLPDGFGGDWNYYYDVDLLTEADNWGVTLSDTTFIRFQFYDDVWANGGGEGRVNGWRHFDDIQIYSVRPGGVPVDMRVEASGQDYFNSADLLIDGDEAPYEWSWTQDGNSVYWYGQEGSLVFEIDAGAPAC